MDAKPTCHEMRIDRSFSLFQINVISNEHFTVIEDTGVTEDKEFICNNNSDCEDVKLEPYEIYDQVKCEFCGKDFNSKNSAGKVLVLTDHKCVEIILVSFGLVEQQ